MIEAELLSRCGLYAQGGDKLGLAATDLYLAVSGHIAAQVDKPGSIAVVRGCTLRWGLEDFRAW